MSKKFTTQQKLMQATQYGIRVYAQQRGNGNDSERLKLEKIANEIGEYWGLEKSVSGYPKLFEEIMLQGLWRYASEMQYTHGEAEQERIKEILDLVHEIQNQQFGPIQPGSKKGETARHTFKIKGNERKVTASCD